MQNEEMGVSPGIGKKRPLADPQPAACWTPGPGGWGAFGHGNGPGLQTFILGDEGELGGVEHLELLLGSERRGAIGNRVPAGHSSSRLVRGWEKNMQELGCSNYYRKNYENETRCICNGVMPREPFDQRKKMENHGAWDTDPGYMLCVSVGRSWVGWLNIGIS